MNNQVEKIQTGVTLNMETGEYEPVFLEDKPKVAEVKAVEKTEEKADKKIVKMRITKSPRMKVSPWVKKHGMVMEVLAELPETFRPKDFTIKSAEMFELAKGLRFNRKMREYYCSKNDDGTYRVNSSLQISNEVK